MVNGSIIEHIKLFIEGYSGDGYRKVTQVRGFNTISEVKYGRNSQGYTVLILKRRTNNRRFNCGWVNIANVYTGVTYSGNMHDKSQYKIEFVKEEDYTDFIPQGSLITYDGFEKDTRYALQTQINNEFNNVYDQLSAKANTRLSNVVSDLSATKKKL